MQRTAAVLGAIVLGVSISFQCFAEGGAKPATSSKQRSAPNPQTLKIEAVQLSLLIKSTIMAVQHANQTGNYSVLRDLGTPVFRESFDQARLTAIFSNLRSRGVNLSAAMLLTPNLTKQPELNANGKLHIVGNFATQPLQIQYDILFLQLDEIWRVDGLAVDAVSPQAMATAVTSKNEPAK